MRPLKVKENERDRRGEEQDISCLAGKRPGRGHVNHCSRIYPSFQTSTCVLCFIHIHMAQTCHFLSSLSCFVLDLCCVPRRRSWRRGEPVFEPCTRSSAVPADVDALARAGEHTHTQSQTHMHSQVSPARDSSCKSVEIILSFSTSFRCS